MATSALAKLRSHHEPQIVRELPPRIAHWGPPGATMVIPTPAEVDAVMRQVRRGKVITINIIRECLARRHGTTIACPITTGIFAGIAAKAAEELRDTGVKRFTAYWRTVKSDGCLNDKYPGGIKAQRRKLQAEGVRIVKKGKRYMVEDLDRRLAKVK